MNNEQILTSDPLDLLFDERNKSYGAYPLRKFYPNRIKTSLLIMFGLSILFSAFTMLPDTKEVKDNGGYFTTGATLAEAAPEKKPEKPKEMIVAKTTRPSTQIFAGKPLIVQQDDSADLINTLKADVKFSDVDYHSVDPGIIDVVGTGDPRPASGAPTDPEPAVIPNLPTENPDVQPTYPGGEKELVRFLQNNLRAPGELEAEETVVVRVRFVVGFDGNLQAFDVVKDGGENFNREVIRVLKKMPQWIPGKKGGQNVPVYYTIPVKFTSSE